ncbi:MAG: HlyD family efflux transporter periplasmic adaptor subunit [Muribaculaceae bacterium]|nr:HlyD family efflux transporter periplasmic adaptor subunit [Muribaculaceae bacterium]
MKKILYILPILLTFFACHNKEKYDATGIFEATTVIVSAETAGKIESMPIVEGDSVTKGELIAQVDTTMFSIQLKQLMSQRKSAESSSPDISAQASALRSQIAHQEQECARFGRLLEDGATTQKTYDDAVAYLKTLQGQLEALLSSLNKSKTSINDNSEAIYFQAEQIREQIEKCIIKSPLSGTILIKYAEPGEYATPGKPLYKIADMENIYLRSYFTCDQLANLKLGQEVTVIADFGGDEQFEYPGTITWISDESEFTPKSIQTKDSRANLVYAVKIAVKNDGRLKLGQYGEVRL